MPRPLSKQQQAIRKVNAERGKKARVLALRLSPYISQMQALGYSQRRIAEVLTEAGAVTPSAFDPASQLPIKATNTLASWSKTEQPRWTQTQVARLIPLIDDARRRLAFWAKRRKVAYGVKGSSQVWRRDPRRLFAYPSVLARVEQEYLARFPQEPRRAEDLDAERIVAEIVRERALEPKVSPPINRFTLDPFDPDEDDAEWRGWDGRGA